MNEEKYEEMITDIEKGVSDCLEDNPQINSDDVFHDIAEGVCISNYTEFPAEVNEVWRRNFGETWDERQREIRAMQIALGRENNGPVGSE